MSFTDQGNAIQNFLDSKVHPALFQATGIDMDELQKNVFENIPPANKQNGFVFTGAMLLFWLLYISWLHNGGTRLIFKMFGFEKEFDKFDFAQRCKVVIICTSQLNVMFWLPLFPYALLYADG